MSILATLGALLIGSLISVYLSGTVLMQVVVYFQLYPNDHIRTKLTVASIWLLDLVHTIMLSASNWYYLIQNFEVPGIADHIPMTVAATIALTAFITFIVHCFFTHRVFAISGNNLFITVPTFLLSLARLGFALTSTAKMLKTKNFPVFVNEVSWVFTVGLSLAVAVDILIAASLCWFLNRNRTGFSTMDRVINSITLYTIENGLATCIVTILSLIFWVVMPLNLVFLGLHFAISKMYANALLASLNARARLRERSESDREMSIMFPSHRLSNRMSQFPPQGNFGLDNRLAPSNLKLQINIEKTIDVIGNEDLVLPGMKTNGLGDMSVEPTKTGLSDISGDLGFGEAY